MAHSPSLPTPRSRAISNAPLLTRGLVVTVGLLGVALMFSIALGAAEMEVSTVIDALFRFDATNFNHLVIQTVRLPRVLAGVTIGVSLAVVLSRKERKSV